MEENCGSLIIFYQNKSLHYGLLKKESLIISVISLKQGENLDFLDNQDSLEWRSD